MHIGLDQSSDLTELEKSKRQGSRGKLNVILHGVFAFDQRGDEIVAHIPSMGTEHQYKAGTWLAETTLQEHADLRLEGVIAQDLNLNLEEVANKDELKIVGNSIKGYQLDPEHNIIFRDVPLFENGHKCHCEYATLRLPYPPYPIQSLRRLKIRADALGGDSSQEVLHKREEVESSAVQVLTYEFDSDADLRLDDHSWEPVLQDEYVNLHVFSEPERSPLDDHVRQAFQSSMGLFVGVDLTLTGRVPPPDPEVEIPKGMHALELHDLSQRQLWLAALGLS